MNTGTFREQWGPLALWDLFALKSLLKYVGDFSAKTLLPVARLLVDDPALLDRNYRNVMDNLERIRPFDSPRERWRILYANFIRELEFVLSELKPRMSDRDFEVLVVDGVHERLEQWIGFLKPHLQTMSRKGPAANGGKRGVLREVNDGPFRNLIPVFGSVASFLVGPVEARLADEGYLEMRIPECALHKVVGDGKPQDYSCLYACKAACEKLFGKNDAMAFDFDPELPGFGCTLRVYMAGHPRIPERIGTFPQIREYCRECGIASGCDKRKAQKNVA